MRIRGGPLSSIRRCLFPLAILMILLGGAACTRQAPPQASEPAIMIGHMGPLTGGAASIGQEQLNFTRVAVQIFSEQTGLEVQIVEGDTMLNPDEGRAVAERFAADDSILAVIGPAGSQVCEAVQPIFADAGLAQITPSCTNPALTNPGTPTFFRPIPTDADQGPTDARYMLDELGATSVFLINDQSTYAVGLNEQLTEALQSLGMEDIQRAEVTQQDPDFSSLAVTIVVANSDIVFFPGQIAGQLVNLIVRLREQGWEGIYFLPDGGFDITWVEAAGAAAEDTYVSFFAPDSHNVASMSEYNRRYEEQYGEFGSFGGASALSARIALEAIQRCQTRGTLTRGCVRDEIAGTNIQNSILEYPVSFDEQGQLEGGQFFIYRVVDGAFVLIGP